jgi:hypothetical protein
LRSWLELPGGPWPPDHYTLLGLGLGAGSFPDIEARVLDRMERLRPHQLRHPDLVTEGMNRLAQALVCLTDPVARAAYDRGVGVPPAPFEVVADGPENGPGGGPALPADAPTEVPFEPGLRPPGERRPPAYEVVEEPDQLPYEVVPLEEDRYAPVFEVVPELEPEPESPPVDSARVPAPPFPAPLSRRAAYRRLAAVRRAVRAWDHLRPAFGTPAESLATPVAVLLCVRALDEARAVLPGVAEVIREPGSPGGTVAALVRLPHALHALRLLLPAQRQAVALDWRRGYDALARERARLRGRAGAVRRRAGCGAARRLGRELRRTPEWSLLVVALAALLFALLRRNP